MIDLTEYSLEELQNKIKKTIGGDDVEIYAIHKDQEFPILGSLLDGCERLPEDWKKFGNYMGDPEKHINNLDLSAFTTEIDYNQLPVDTLIEVDGIGKRYTAGMTPCNGDLVFFFSDGRDSNTEIEYTRAEKETCKLITNPRKGWFGGEIGIPDGVRLGIWENTALHPIKIYKNYIKVMDEDLRKKFNDSKEWIGITSYQILGEDYQEGDEL
jgi:hypothetical protein